jgi:hypothetical protein
LPESSPELLPESLPEEMRSTSTNLLPGPFNCNQILYHVFLCQP